MSVLKAQIADKFKQTYKFVDCAAFSVVKSGRYAFFGFLHLQAEARISTILNSPKLEATKMSINSQMDRYMVVQSPKGLLYSNENECSITA